jgi:nitrogen fixation/metabolism regulation signal transduction histidine kinase
VNALLQKLKFEHKVLWLGLAAALPGILVAVWVLWSNTYSPWTRWILAGMLGGAGAIAISALYRQVVRPLQTVSNLLAALREEDFSTRASGAQPGDALGDVYVEINTLSQLLQDQRLGALEATALLRTVMEEIDVAVFAFDEKRRLKLVNRAGQRLLAQPSERLIDRTAEDLRLAHCLEGDAVRTWAGSFPSGLGRWSMRRTSFRQGGRPHDLLVVSDLSRALREEERQAWQRLIRVLGHEINNSLAPIKSLASSLDRLVRQDPLPTDWRDDAVQGLGVISSRTEGLGRFMTAYTQLARLPSPKLGPVQLGPWIERVAGMETRVKVQVRPGSPVEVKMDSDQLEQVMINLLRNAADAVLGQDKRPIDAHSAVEVTWHHGGPNIQITVKDSGPGLANTANLFVPFFTTKPQGSGIGLVLCRQITEAHGGTLTLENRKDAPGCVASILLPVG